MQFQFSVAVRNAELEAIEAVIGASAIMEIRAGAKPANCAASRTGAVLATLALPADWLANASGGVKNMSGTWTDSSADATGAAGYFTIYASDGVTVGMQGDITVTGGGGALTVDSTSFTMGQSFTVTAFTMTAGNA